ncbi:hypothetical protein CHF27_010940 [Romboutsia maritimum]|uniref:Uncharacterized protein n=1 Tax=Romboutsia maritimum TaxID=2020948 RepID=A0A371IR13_9FIRM|nr:hypothetical protein [Romboutsia maritimum]RDY22926.1 hypothetical protein CHF27_010940 [Romboutsia maritimum]
MSKLVTLSQRNLLLKSDILKDYPKLKSFLETTPDMDSSELHTLDKEVRNLFNSKIFNAISNKAPQEWEVDKDRTLESAKELKNITRCQICNTKIKNICYIKNKINNNRLIVGSTCVTYFGILDKKELEKILSEREIIRRRAEINKSINNIEKTFQELDLFIEKSPIIIKNKVINKFVVLKSEAVDLHTKYIDSNLDSNEKIKIINRIKDILPKIRVEKNKIIEYIDKNKVNKFIVTKGIYRSVGYDDRCIPDLEEDGFVSERNIFRVKDIKFIKSIIGDFNKHLIDHNMKIIRAYEYARDIYYQIDMGNKRYAIVDYKYSDFAFNYGSLVFGEEPLEEISLDKVFRNSKIRSEVTINTILNSIEDIIIKKEFELEDVNKEFNEIIIKNCKNDRYIILNFSETIDIFKELAISSNKKLHKDVIDYILSCKNTKSYYEMDSYRRQTSI